MLACEFLVWVNEMRKRWHTRCNRYATIDAHPKIGTKKNKSGKEGNLLLRFRAISVAPLLTLLALVAAPLHKATSKTIVMFSWENAASGRCLEWFDSFTVGCSNRNSYL